VTDFDKREANEDLRREDLASAARALKQEVADLREAVDHLAIRTGRAERATFRTSLVASLLLVVVLLLGWTSYAQHETSQRLEGLIQRALCPVFALVVGGYDPATRPEGPARDKYVANFEVMRAGYEELACRATAPLVPPRTPGS
jgi:hypothetical protein